MLRPILIDRSSAAMEPRKYDRLKYGFTFLLTENHTTKSRTHSRQDICTYLRTPPGHDEPPSSIGNRGLRHSQPTQKPSHAPCCAVATLITRPLFGSLGVCLCVCVYACGVPCFVVPFSSLAQLILLLLWTRQTERALDSKGSVPVVCVTGVNTGSHAHTPSARVTMRSLLIALPPRPEVHTSSLCITTASEERK